MDKIQKLQKMRKDSIGSMRALVSKADEEKRNLTDEEGKTYEELKASVSHLDNEITREKELHALETSLEVVNSEFTVSQTPPPPDNNQRALPDNGFKNLGEFFFTIATNRSDPRLMKIDEKRASQQVGTGQLGGFVLPEQFDRNVKQVQPQEALIRPRATVIAAGDPPDAKLTIPTLDQGANRNMYGGVVVYHKGEQANLTETNIFFKQVTFEPNKMTGYLVVTNELLRNWDACTSFVEKQMRLAKIGSEDYDFLRGDGAAKAAGVFNASCAIAYNRATAAQIAYADIVGMYARAKFGGGLVWLASQTTIPQLVNIRDTANNNMWHVSATQGVPPTLMGFDVLWAERCPGLGTKGDLLLADLSYYLIKDGSGPFVDLSKEVFFTSDQTCFRIIWNVDGHPWLEEPIPLEGSTSNTISPIVILE